MFLLYYLYEYVHTIQCHNNQIYCTVVSYCLHIPITFIILNSYTIITVPRTIWFNIYWTKLIRKTK